MTLARVSPSPTIFAAQSVYTTTGGSLPLNTFMDRGGQSRNNQPTERSGHVFLQLDIASQLVLAYSDRRQASAPYLAEEDGRGEVSLPGETRGVAR